MCAHTHRNSCSRTHAYVCSNKCVCVLTQHAGLRTLGSVSRIKGITYVCRFTQARTQCVQSVKVYMGAQGSMVVGRPIYGHNTPTLGTPVFLHMHGQRRVFAHIDARRHL